LLSDSALSEGRAHGPLAGFFILVEEAEGDVVVHGGADIAGGDLDVEGAAETWGVGSSQASFLKKTILTGSLMVSPGG